MFPRIFKKLQQWQEESNSVNILVTGKTGTGKSALINSITGHIVSTEGNTLKPETKRIEYTIKQVGSVRLQVWDSPGLQDGFVKEDGTKFETTYVQEIVQSCSEFDLIVYTIRMSQSRILKNGPDCRAMQILSQPNALGANMWHNTIIVLTFANIAEEMISEDMDKSDSILLTQERFKAELESSITAIRKILTESVGLSKQLADSIPIVPSGYKKGSATLPKYNYKVANGERYYWLSDLWLKALRVTKLDAQPAMIKVNKHRMAQCKEEYKDRMYATKTAIVEEMPLIFIEKGASIGKQLYHMFYGVGTTIGATLGAGFSHYLSFALLYDQGSKNKVITEEDSKSVQKYCDLPETEDGFLII